MNIAPHQYIGNIESCNLVYPTTGEEVEAILSPVVLSAVKDRFVLLTGGRDRSSSTTGGKA